MAKVKSGIKVDTKKKIVTVYSNLKQTKEDKEFITIYVSNGYKLATAKKPYSPSTKEMEKTLKQYADSKVYDAYKTAKEENDYFGSCGIYQKWDKSYYNELKKKANEKKISEKTLKETYKYKGLLKAIELVNIR